MFKIKRLIMLLGVVLPLILSCSLASSPLEELSRNQAAIVTAPATTGFHITDGKLLDGNENPFVMRGVNHAHTWYKSQIDATLTALAIKGANSVRIVLSDGTHPDYGSEAAKDKIEDIRAIIEKCKEKQIICMLEVHDATGSDDLARLNNAVNYFIEMKDALIGQEDYVIINIANEWHGSWSSSVWADGYIAAIPALRAAGLKHTLIIDCAGYGQYPKSIVDRGVDVFASDTLSNTMFSIHMYEYAGGTPAQVTTNIDNVLALGLPLIIGEFGHKHTGGDVAEQTILDYCETKQIGWLAWSWKGNSGGVEYLDIVEDWEGTTLTDYGEIIVNGVNGIKATSKVCTIFGDPVDNFAPSVSAGADKSLKLLNSKMSGSITDDGRPSTGTLSSIWSKVSGPGTVIFTDAANTSSSVQFSDYGVYVLKLSANDGELIASDTVTVTIVNEPVDYQPIAGKIEIEDYDEYYDTSKGNDGGAYKTDDVDIETCNEGGYDIGWTEAGEWLRYYVEVLEAGDYTIEVRVATPESGKGFHIEMNDVDITGPVIVTATGGWQTWQTVTIPSVNLNAGKQFLTFSFDTDLFNINWINFKKNGGTTNEPPTVNLNSPSDNAIFSSTDTINITAHAADTDGTIAKVEFYAGSVKIAEDTTVPYSYSWNNATAGTYIVTARAFDNLNARTTSQGRTIIVEDGNGNLKPTVSISSPLTGSTINVGENLVINATAADSDGTVSLVEFFAGNLKIGEDAIAPYSYTWVTPIKGTYSITAKATDNESASTISDTVSIEVKGISTGKVAIVYLVKNQWNSGFQGEITITNNTSEDITGWELAFDYASGQVITSGWVGDYTQTGTSVVVKNLSWNSVIKAGESLVIGFQGTYSGTNVNPTAFTLNGVATE